MPDTAYEHCKLRMCVQYKPWLAQLIRVIGLLILYCFTRQASSEELCFVDKSPFASTASQVLYEEMHSAFVSCQLAHTAGIQNILGIT